MWNTFYAMVVNSLTYTFDRYFEVKYVMFTASGDTDFSLGATGEDLKYLNPLFRTEIP